MDFKDTLEKRLNDPEFCRALISELRDLIAENEKLRQELERYRT